MKYYIIVWATWLVSELLLLFLKKSPNRDKTDRDKNTLTLLWFSIIGSITIAVYMNIYVDLPIGKSMTLPNVGLMLMVVGIIIRFIAIISLGKLFTVDVSIQENHTLKTNGMYHFVRHPAYSGLLLTAYGLGLSFNNWLSLAFIAFFITTTVIKRIYTEENALIQHFEKEYLEYQQRTKRIIPFIF